MWPGGVCRTKFMARRGLTARQRSVLDFLTGFMDENGYAPSLREIAAHLGINAPKNAAKHLAALERKGFVRRTAGLSRAVDVVGVAPGVGRPPGGGAGGAGEAYGLAVPVAGRVRAGTPHLAVEDVTGHVTLDERFFRCRGAFLLKVEGESMTGAGIDDGDHVLVRPQATAETGEIVVALVGGEATVKRLVLRPGEIALMPENPDFDPVVVRADADGEAAAEVEIVGVVLSVVKRIEH